jgi:hypothetical protein
MRSPRTAALVPLAALAFCAAAVVNALRKGGDFQWFVEAGRRTLAGLPLYAGSSAGYGVIGPPFQGVFFVPFAALDAWSPVAARLAWCAASLVFLYWGIRCWALALTPSATKVSFGSRAVVLPLLALVFPLLTNFEHQNLNPLLLFLLGAAALTAARSRRGEAWCGALVAVAAALKAFPALLVVHLAYRRSWRGAASAVAAGLALTLLPMAWCGPAAYLDQITTWLGFSGSGWPTRANNQSLVAAVDRMLLGPHAMSSGRPLTALLAGALAAALLALFAFTSARADRSALPRELALVTLLAVLFSPIAWDHYWVLLFPAYFLAYAVSEGRPWARRAVWLAAVLTSALTPFTLGRRLFAVVREWSPQTLAALVVFGILCWAAGRGIEAPRAPGVSGPERTRTTP